jgi:hypothetical protein
MEHETDDLNQPRTESADALDPVEAARPELPPEAESWPRCGWCSTKNPPQVEKCAECGAALVAPPEILRSPIVGLTQVDPGLVEHDQWLRSRHQKKRSGILSSLFASDEDSPPRAAAAPMVPVDESAILPPSDDVKLEIARLEAELAYARALAEAQSRMIDQRLEQADEAAAQAREATAPVPWAPVEPWAPAAEPPAEPPAEPDTDASGRPPAE